MKKTPIFIDYTGKRRRRIKRFSIVSLFLGFSILGLFIYSIFQPLSLPTVHFERPQSQKQDVYAYVNLDYPQSIQSLQQHIHSIDVVMPDALVVHKDAVLIHKEYPEELSKILYDRENETTKIVPTITVGSDQYVDTVKQFLHPQNRKVVTEQIVNQLSINKYDGVNLQLSWNHDLSTYHYLLVYLKEQLHQHEKELYITIGEKFSLDEAKRMLPLVDKVIIKYYNEESLNSETLLDMITLKNELAKWEDSKDKLVISLPMYGLASSEVYSEKLSFTKVMSELHNQSQTVNWDENTHYFTSSILNDEGLKEEVWFSDATTFYNQLRYVTENKIVAIAIDALGYEDPSIWSIVNKQMRSTTHVMETLSEVKPLTNFLQVGKGEVVEVESIYQVGARQFDFTKDYLIKNVQYSKFPTPFRTFHTGGDREKLIVLTFDDGPTQYTEEILKTLKEYNLKATFFVTGEQSLKNPEILQQIVRDGHEIGNHTFTHSNITEISSYQTTFELQTTQKIIERVTGYSTKLFRIPYTVGVEQDEKQMMALRNAQDLGFIFVGAYIDSRDWNNQSSAQILDNMKDQLPNGNIILLHDGGGDRTGTVEALPHIIEYLQNEGYRIVTVHELLNLEKKDIMPMLDRSSMNVTGYMLQTGYYILEFCKIVFFSFLLVVIFLILIRMILFFYLSYKHKQSSRETDNSYQPKLSVIIPVFNEENVIRETISSVLESNYPNFEVIIVDDGSTDRTPTIINKYFGTNERVSLIKKKNRGKASALNEGINKAKGEIIVTMDADTLLHKDALLELANSFKEELVAAVSGNVKVGNLINPLTKWQHIEYVTSFNFEKRALEMLNSITVVPGALGAWRKKDLLKVNAFERDTMAEDTDLTIKLVRTGKQVLFNERALGYTEVPVNMKQFIKQRVRWYFGILQCVWKHKDTLFKRKYKGLGYIGIPNIVIQILFQIFIPIIDLLLLFVLLSQSYHLLVYFFLFFLIDFMVALYSFKLEGEKLKPLWWIPIQRFVYRVVLAYITWKVTLKAINGISVKWNKLERVGQNRKPF